MLFPAEFPASFEEILSSIGPDRDIWTDGKHVQGAMVPWTDVVVAMVETSLNRLLECLPSVQSLLLVRKAMADSLSEELRKVPSLKFIGNELGIQISAVYDRFDLSTKARLRVLISDRLNLLLSKLETHLREAIFSNETKDLHMDMVASLKGIKLGGPRLAVRSRFPGNYACLLWCSYLYVREICCWSGVFVHLEGETCGAGRTRGVIEFLEAFHDENLNTFTGCFASAPCMVYCPTDRQIALNDVLQY